MMGCCFECRKEAKTAKSPTRELWRLRLNWIFFIMLLATQSISYTSLLPSFHQFITNPRPEDLNKTEHDKIPPGLGQSEIFYSWAIAIGSVGGAIGALLSGYLTKLIPYWHLVLVSLVVHTISYVIYAVTWTAWLLLLSRLLSGMYIGSAMTLGFAYMGSSYEDYHAALKELGKEDSKRRLKDKLFVLDTFGISTGYLLGQGVTVIFAQFDIDQFRSIAWFNVATGMTLIVLLFLMFHGESKCKKLAKKCKNLPKKCKCSWTTTKLPERVEFCGILIIGFLIAGRSVVATRYSVVQLLFNPILSDSFGFDERDATYFFFGTAIIRIGGSILTLFILQLLKPNSRQLLIVSLITSVASLAVIADWQSIPHDHCTQYSPFHHPNLAEHYRNELEDSHSLSKVQSQVPIILHAHSYKWEAKGSRLLEDIAQDGVQVQVLQVVESSIYSIAASTCENVNNSKYGCHWIPDSLITKKRCVDCQPICRSVYQTLNFAQFCVGTVLFEIATPALRASVTAVISASVSKASQGLVFGTSVASCSSMRLITALWLTAAYEGVQKRTFLPMAIMIATILPFLLGLILIYPTLGKRELEIRKANQEACKDGTDQEDSLHLIPAKQLDNSE